MKLKALLLALFVAGVTASFALADSGHGKSGDHRGSDNRAPVTSTTATTTVRADDDADKGKSKSICRPKIELELAGKVAAGPSATALALLVVKGGAQGASLAGKQLTLDVSGLKKPVAVRQGDSVRVHARACVDLATLTVNLVAESVSSGKGDHGTGSTTTTTSSSTTTTLQTTTR